MFQDYSQDFGPFNGQVWLNCSHQGALPRAAAEAAAEAVAWKTAPYNLSTDRFSEVPQRLKSALGRVFNAPAEEIILANSASYGLHLMANGLPLQAGDEVLLAANDFPSDILPWLSLEKKGVKVKRIKPKNQVLEVEDVEPEAGRSAKVLCLTWVHSFSGWAVDLEALGKFCRERGIVFFLNCSQALGARELDVRTSPIDAITSVGFKYLMGPYGTGFCWMRPEILETLDYNQAYWLAQQTADDLGAEPADITVRTGLGARKYDVFGTANFFNFMPLTASVEYLLGIGVETAAAHDQALVSRLVEGLDRNKYELISPPEGPARSNLVVLTHRQGELNKGIYDDLKARGIHGAFRRGNMRFSPHLYNTPDDIDLLLETLKGY